jgi:DNA polymerase-3 subunit epsilon
LRDYLEVPFPEPGTPVESLPLLALDLETTALRPREGHIVSVGYVPVDGLRVELSGAGHVLVADGGEVGQSATVHGITDDAKDGGVPLEEALRAVLEALAGRVLLAHFAPIEVGYLAAATERLWGAPLPMVVVDTMDLERRLVTDHFVLEPQTGALRLWGARARYGLPRYRAHEALTDAIACAELFLAQAAELHDRHATLTLKDVRA